MNVRRTTFVWFIAVAAMGGGCSSDPTDDQPCTDRAPFDLSVRVQGSEPLPSDTALEVEYGGVVAVYRLDSKDNDQETIVCDATDSDAGADASPKELLVLHCRLWSSGYTTVKITVSGYSDLKRDLTPDAEDDCVKTTSVEMILGEDDDAGN